MTGVQCFDRDKSAPGSIDLEPLRIVDYRNQYLLFPAK
jgi:hypothetical protein